MRYCIDHRDFGGFELQANLIGGLGAHNLRPFALGAWRAGTGPFTGGIHLTNSGTYPGTVALDYGRDGGTTGSSIPWNRASAMLWR